MIVQYNLACSKIPVLHEEARARAGGPDFFEANHCEAGVAKCC